MIIWLAEYGNSKKARGKLRGQSQVKTVSDLPQVNSDIDGVSITTVFSDREL